MLECALLLAVLVLSAAIAVPWILHLRESAATARVAELLRAVVFPAQVQFQGGGYLDIDCDMVGEYGHIGHLIGGLATNKVKAGTISLLQGPLAEAPGPQVVKPASGHGLSGWICDLTPADEATTGGPPLIEGTPLPVIDVRRANWTATANNGERFWMVAAVPLAERFGARVMVIREDGKVRSPPETASALPWTVDGKASAAGMAAGARHALVRQGDLSSGLQAGYAVIATAGPRGSPAGLGAFRR